MTTITDNPPSVLAAAPQISLRETAMAHYASGRTAAGRRAFAKLPLAVSRLAAIYGVDPEALEAELLAQADEIDAIVAEGITRIECWYATGLDQFHGPFPLAAVA